ncbi:MAG: hypothetical protein ABMB14_11915 [Myxococcota bacterium]
MRWFAGLAGAIGLGACGGGGDDTSPRPELEVCDDGEDNDGDSLVDCDDTQDCGGIHCQNTGDDDDDTTPTEPATIEILFDETSCCDFTFTSEDCPSKTIGTFSVLNRSLEDDGDFDVSCDLVGPGLSAIKWQPEDASSKQAFVVASPIYANNQVEVTGYFDCVGTIDTEFTTACNITANVGSETAVLDFEITGTPN